MQQVGLNKAEVNTLALVDVAEIKSKISTEENVLTARYLDKVFANYPMWKTLAVSAHHEGCTPETLVTLSRPKTPYVSRVHGRRNLYGRVFGFVYDTIQDADPLFVKAANSSEVQRGHTFNIPMILPNVGAYWNKADAYEEKYLRRYAAIRRYFRRINVLCVLNKLPFHVHVYIQESSLSPKGFFASSQVSPKTLVCTFYYGTRHISETQIEAINQNPKKVAEILQLPAITHKRTISSFPDFSAEPTSYLEATFGSGGLRDKTATQTVELTSLMGSSGDWFKRLVPNRLFLYADSFMTIMNTLSRIRDTAEFEVLE